MIPKSSAHDKQDSTTMTNTTEIVSPNPVLSPVGQERSTVFHLSEFKTVQKLGSGRFGKVVLATTQRNHLFKDVPCIDGAYLYAIKIINNNRFDKAIYNLSNANYINKINNEIKIMNYLNKFNHPNILILYSIINNEISNLKINKYYFIMEYCELGELTQNNFSQVPYETKHSCSQPMINIQSKIKDMIKGLEFLHMNQIIHRDIKPSNFLVDAKGNVKLSDLGTNYKLSGNLVDDQVELKNPVGTPLFLPPEICCNTNNSNVNKGKLGSSKTDNDSRNPGISSYFKPKMFHQKKRRSLIDIYYEIDIWALGITFYYLFFGNFPFYNENEFKLFNDIVKNPIHFPHSISDCYLLRRVLNNDRTALNADYNLKMAKYFTLLLDLLKKMLNKDPEFRADMKSLKSHKLLTLFNRENEKLENSFIKFNENFLNLYSTSIHNEKIYNMDINNNNVKSKNQVQSIVRHSKSNNLLNSYQDSPNNNTNDAIRLKGTFAKLFSPKWNQNNTEDTSFDSSFNDFTLDSDSSLLNVDAQIHSKEPISTIKVRNDLNLLQTESSSSGSTSYSNVTTTTNTNTSPSILKLINDSAVSLPNLNKSHYSQHDSHRHKYSNYKPDADTQINYTPRERANNNSNPNRFEYTKSFINELGGTFDSCDGEENNNGRALNISPYQNQRDSLNTLDTINTLPSKLSDNITPNLFQQKAFGTYSNGADNSGVSSSPISDRFPHQESQAGSPKMTRSPAKNNLSKLKQSNRMNFQKVLTPNKPQKDKPKGMLTMDQYLDNL